MCPLFHISQFFFFEIASAFRLNFAKVWVKRFFNSYISAGKIRLSGVQNLARHLLRSLFEWRQFFFK